MDEEEWGEKASARGEREEEDDWKGGLRINEEEEK